MPSEIEIIVVRGAPGTLRPKYSEFGTDTQVFAGDKLAGEHIRFAAYCAVDGDLSLILTDIETQMAAGTSQIR